MPDIRAYAAGEEHHWIPGHRQARASTPIPDGAWNVKKAAALMFLKTLGAPRHVVTYQNAAGDHRGKFELDDSNIADFTDCFATYNG